MEYGDCPRFTGEAVESGLSPSQNENLKIKKRRIV
jgi:hypothetical protein